MTDDDRYQLVVPAPLAGWLTANPRHAGGAWQGRARLIRAWRQATANACLGARMPQGVTPVSITATAYYIGRTAPVRDRLNLAPTMKAIVDGLGPPREFTRKGKLHVSPGYGFLPDDSDRHVRDTSWSLTRGDWPCVELTITHHRAD